MSTEQDLGLDVAANTVRDMVALAATPTLLDLLHDRWYEAEARFCANRYHGAAPADSVSAQCGTQPLLFTACHSVAHMREGTLKVADIGTGGLALTLAATTAAYSLVQDGRAHRDANWYEQCTFKEELAAVLPNVAAVVDVHGMKDSYDIDVCLATGGHPETSRHLLEDLYPRLVAAGLRVAVNTPFDATREHTVTSHCQRAAVPAIELELSRTTRTAGTEQASLLLRTLVSFAHDLSS